MVLSFSLPHVGRARVGGEPLTPPSETPTRLALGQPPSPHGGGRRKSETRCLLIPPRCLLLSLPSLATFPPPRSVGRVGRSEAEAGVGEHHFNWSSPLAAARQP